MNNRDVLSSVQEICDPNTFSDFDRLYPDQKWKEILTELRNKGFIVVPEAKERIHELTKRVQSLEDQYKVVVTFLKQIFEVQQGHSKIGERGRHKLTTNVRNFLIRHFEPY